MVSPPDSPIKASTPKPIAKEVPPRVESTTHRPKRTIQEVEIDLGTDEVEVVEGPPPKKRQTMKKRKDDKPAAVQVKTRAKPKPKPKPKRRVKDDMSSPESSVALEGISRQKMM